MKHVLITSERIRYFISDAEKNHIMRLTIAKEKYAIVQGDLIPLNITPSIISIDHWVENENFRLVTQKKKVCKECGKVVEINIRCECKPRPIAIAAKIEGKPIDPEFLKKMKAQAKRNFAIKQKQDEEMKKESKKNRTPQITLPA